MVPGECCKSGHRKHTPIVSEKQRKLFGAVASGAATKATGLSKKEAVRHLKESKGKNLPEKSDKKARETVRLWWNQKRAEKKGVK